MLALRDRVRSAPARRVLVYAGAGAAIAWFSGLCAIYGLSALSTAGRGGFVGARTARDEVLVILGSAAVALLLSSLAWWLDRCAPPLLLGAGFAGVAAGLCVTTGQAGEVLAAIVLLLWAWSAGNVVLERGLGVAPRHTGPAAHAVIATALGIGTLSFVMLALALIGALNDVTIAALLLAGALTFALSLRGLLADARQARPALPPVQFVEQTALVALGVVLLVGFAVCLTPQVNFDALHYHLAMPVTFLREGGFVERPDIIQSYFPLGLETASVAAFWVGGETTANLLHWAFVPLTAVLLWSGGDRSFGRPVGALAAALFALMPLAIWESTAATSDLAMTFFLVAAVWTIVAGGDSANRRLWLVAGLLVGLAVSFKLVAAVYVLPVSLVGALALLRVPLPQASIGYRLRPLLAYAIGGFATGAPWLLLRWAQTGNPVLPLFNNVFRSDRWPPVNERFDLGQFDIGTSPEAFVSLFWEASMHPARFGQESPAWLIGLPLLAAPAALLLLPRLTRLDSGRLLAIAALGALVFYFLLSQHYRYGLPAFALLAPLGAVALVEALRLVTPLGLLRDAFAALLIAVAMSAGVVISIASFSLVPGHFPTQVLLGKETASQYRERGINNYKAIRFFDEETDGTPDEGAILGFPYNYFASNRLYDVIVPATLSPFRRIVESGLPPEAMAAALTRENLRWFIYDSNNPFLYEEWPPAWLARSVLSEQFIANHMEVAFSENGVFVYRIVIR